MQRTRRVLEVLKCSFLWASAYILFSFHPRIEIPVSIFVFGVVPAWPVITTAGAYGRSSVGFLTGFLGTIAFDFLTTRTVLTYALPAVAYGAMGLVAGLARYDTTNGRSLVKLSIVSTIGMILTSLSIVAIEWAIVVYPTITDVVSTLLPLLTIGIPTVFILTPIYAGVWHYISKRIATYRQVRTS
jgi:hypothetical protein